jgi:type IV pilus assembly protein PilF
MQRLPLLLCLMLGLVAACGPSRDEVKARKTQAEYHYNLAYGYLVDPLNPNADAALQEIHKSLALKEDYAQAHMVAGLVFLGRESHVKAERHFRRAVELKPDYLKALNNLGATYLAMERYAAAIPVFEKLVGNILYQTPGNGHNNLGWAHYKLGDNRKAERHFRTAIQLAPRLCPPYNNLAMLLIDESRLPRARRYLNRCIKRCPNYAEPHYHLGRLAVKENALERALDHFDRCVKLGGEAPLAERCENRLAHLSGQRLRR